MRKSQAVFAVCFVVLTLAHAVVGYFDARIPAWKMFKQMPRFSYAIEDRFGEPIDVRDYMQKRAYVIGSARTPYKVAEWLAQTQPERLPIAGLIDVWRDGEKKRVRFRFDPVAPADAPQLTAR